MQLSLCMQVSICIPCPTMRVAHHYELKGPVDEHVKCRFCGLERGIFSSDFNLGLPTCQNLGLCLQSILGQFFPTCVGNELHFSEKWISSHEILFCISALDSTEQQLGGRMSMENLCDKFLLHLTVFNQLRSQSFSRLLFDLVHFGVEQLKQIKFTPL